MRTFTVVNIQHFNLLAQALCPARRGAGASRLDQTKLVEASQSPKAKAQKPKPKGQRPKAKGQRPKAKGQRLTRHRFSVQLARNLLIPIDCADKLVFPLQIFFSL